MTAGYIISLTLSIIFPIVTVIFFLRLVKVNIWLLTAGIVTYIASQIVYFPLQYLYLFLLDKVSPSLSANVPFQIALALISAVLIILCEDGARWLVLKYFKRNADSRESAALIGLGFGTIASIALGVVVAMEFNYVNQLMTPNLLNNLTLTSTELEAIKIEQAYYTALPWYEPATRGLVYFISFLIQVMFTIMIWKGVSQKSWKWLVSAFGTHLAFEFIIILLQKFSPGPWLNVLVVIAFGSILLAVLYQLLFKQWIVEHNAAVAAAKREKQRSK